MIVPAGLGFWIAFEKAIDAGPKTRDLEVAVDRCKRAGATWVALRAGAGGANDAALDGQSIRAFIDAGIDVYVWIFSYPATASSEVAGYRKWFVAGARGAIINAEFEYQAATAQQARALVAAIRLAWHEAQGERRMSGLDPITDEAFVAHAPPDYLGAGVNHALSDELVALDEVCDAIMPQVYAWEHDDSGHVHHVRNVMRGYAKRGLYADRVWCVGCTYRPKTRGYEPTGELDDKGKPKVRPKPLGSLPNEPQRVAEDVIAFLDDPYIKAAQAPSLYSLDAMTWIDARVGTAVMDALERRARRTDPVPAPEDPPITKPHTPSSKSMRAVSAEAATPLRAGEGEHTPIHLRSEETP